MLNYQEQDGERRGIKMRKYSYMPGQFGKKCSCGACYTLEQWQTLRFRFVQPGSEEGIRYYYDCEHRDCKKCGSTIAVKLREEK